MGYGLSVTSYQVGRPGREVHVTGGIVGDPVTNVVVRGGRAGRRRR